MPPNSPAGGPTRGTPVWLLAIATAMLIARVALGLWDANNPEGRPELVTWTAPSAATEEARASGRLVLYAFTDRGNAASRKLSSEVFANPEFAQRLAREFVAVRIEGDAADDSPDIAALRATAAGTRLPSLFVTSADGARSKLVPGYQNARATMEALTMARMEVMDLPFTRDHRGGRSFRFQLGGNRGGGDSSAAEADSLAGGR